MLQLQESQELIINIPEHTITICRLRTQKEKKYRHPLDLLCFMIRTTS